MTDTTRRGFLAVAGVGAAGIAAVSVVGSRSGSASAGVVETNAVTELASNASGAIVAYVKDVRDGQISLMVGERAVVIRDKDLVARLSNAAKK